MKLAKAAPRIIANNLSLTRTMLEFAKGIVVEQTPLGPGHFGYHGRDTVKVATFIKGKRTEGQLRAAVQLYWREKGTKRGERAYMTAHKAVYATRRFISFYYGGMAKWWKL